MRWASSFNSPLSHWGWGFFCSRIAYTYAEFTLCLIFLDCQSHVISGNSSICTSTTVNLVNLSSLSLEKETNQLLPLTLKEKRVYTWVLLTLLPIRRLLNYFCLLQWLRGLPTSRQSFNIVFGECPYCSKVSDFACFINTQTLISHKYGIFMLKSPWFIKC